ncbi:MAG: 4Fe-4S dicluster domain-containing protein [Raoultibacter sp.]
MTRYGMLINTKDCIGCYTCRVSCQRQNGLVPTEAFIRFLDSEGGVYPSVKTEVVPVQCMHCTDAPCAKACPTGATYVAEGGIVKVDQEKCIGCKYCMAVCPYHARVINEVTGAVDKCRLCAVELAKSDTPNCSCASACLTGCRIVGDLDDPESDIAKTVLNLHARPLTGDPNANIYYVR